MDLWEWAREAAARYEHDGDEDRQRMASLHDEGTNLLQRDPDSALAILDEGRALALFLIRRQDSRLLGAITLDNIRRGPSQSGQVGYWIGPEFARQGLMREALTAVVHHAFTVMDLSRIEAACLPENVASRALLARAGFREEGMAEGYLQIGGRWREHVLYAILRADRRRTGE